MFKTTPNSNFNHKLVWVLLLIILLQLLNIFYWASQKQGFHLDEIFSYQNSNGTYGLRMHQTSEYMHQWHDKEYFMSHIVVSDGSNYNTVLKNLSFDDHPPLFFLFLHTSGSLLPNQFTKWTGIIPNMIYFTVSAIMLFFISLWFFKGKKIWLALLPVLIWGFSAGAISTIIYIRMYAMQTMWILCAVYCHLRLQDVPDSKKWLSLSGFFSFLAFMTHFYSLVFIFFLAAFYFIFYLIRRQWKFAIFYSISIGAALIMLIIIWPATIQQILSGGRGTQAISNFSDSSRIFLGENLSLYLQIISRALLNGLGKEYIAILFVLALIIFLKKIVNKFKIQNGIHIQIAYKNEFGIFISEKAINFLIILFSVCFTLVIISKIAPYQTSRYVMMLFPLVILSLILLTEKLFFSLQTNKYKSKYLLPAFLLIIFLVTLQSYNNERIEFLYPDKAARLEVAKQYKNYDAIYIIHNTGDINDSFLEMLEFKKVYPTNKDAIPTIGNILDYGNHPGLVIFIDTDYVQQEVIDALFKSTEYKSCEELYKSARAIVYYLH